MALAGSMKVPVQIPLGSGMPFGWGKDSLVSLYETRVRLAVPAPSMLGARRVFQKTSLPLKYVWWTPARRAFSAFVNCSWVQYSSCPEDMKTLWFCSSVPPRTDMSMPDM